MLLQKLKEYADDRMKVSPTLYRETPVRYIIELDARGRPLTPSPTDTADPSSPKTRRGQPRLVPEIQRAAGIKPILFADKADYTLAYQDAESKPERVKACHAAYREIVTRCATVTQEPAINAIQTFLDTVPLEQLKLGDDFDPSGFITFRVAGVFPAELPSVQAFWAAEHDPATSGAPVMQCVVCGQTRPVLERWQKKIKGIPGGQPSGTALISANSDAFESHGLSASLIAPTCAPCGESVINALNALLASRESSLRLSSSAVFAFWTRAQGQLDLRALFDDPQPEAVQRLLESPRTGKPVAVREEAFYATVLSGSGGRAVVRDWMDTTVGAVEERLRGWFVHQRIIGPRGEEPRPLGLLPLAGATVRDLRDLSPTLLPLLLKAALLGKPLPAGLLARALVRCKAEQRVTLTQAALIKLCLLSVGGFQEDSMQQLERGNPAPAYLCGRLMAVLERAQEAALPGINATITDRFFGTASTAPASVFSRLVRGAQPHLAKLRRDNPGAHSAIQRELEETLSGISEFPKVLTLEQQGLFALGYYHQRAAARAQARANSERRKINEQQAQ